ncbi:hypothetical protein [Streptomyces sp. NPDC002913]
MYAGGDFCVAVTLGAKAAGIAGNPRIGVVLRVAVLGDELTGPRHGASVREERPGGTGHDGKTAVAADTGGTGGAGWTGIAIAAGAGAAAVPAAGLVLVRRRRRAGTQTTRGSA